VGIAVQLVLDQSVIPFFLSVDVKLLGKSILSFFRSMLETVGSHPLDCRKFTISSYAANATQLYLMKNKRPGNWHPDYKPLFQVRDNGLDKRSFRINTVLNLQAVMFSLDFLGSGVFRSLEGATNSNKCN